MDVKHNMSRQNVTLEVPSDSRLLHVQVHTVHRKVLCTCQEPLVIVNFQPLSLINRAPPSFSIPLSESLSDVIQVSQPL
jgi:hypothetical protein